MLQESKADRQFKIIGTTALGKVVGQFVQLARLDTTEKFNFLYGRVKIDLLLDIDAGQNQIELIFCRFFCGMDILSQQCRVFG